MSPCLPSPRIRLHRRLQTALPPALLGACVGGSAGRRSHCRPWVAASWLSTAHTSQYVLHFKSSCSWSRLPRQPPPHAHSLFCRKTSEQSWLPPPLTPGGLCLPLPQPRAPRASDTLTLLDDDAPFPLHRLTAALLSRSYGNVSSPGPSTWEGPASVLSLRTSVPLSEALPTPLNAQRPNLHLHVLVLAPHPNSSAGTCSCLQGDTHARR